MNNALNLNILQIDFFYYRFYDEGGDVISTSCKNVSIKAEKIINLEDVKCKFYFMSTSDGIEQLLKSFAPKINVCDATASEKKCIAQISLDVHKLMGDNMVNYRKYIAY